MSKFSWPCLPENEDEFNSMMLALDGVLAKAGLAPWQRTLHIGFKLWDAFNWTGLSSPPKTLIDLPGYSGDILKAKANHWYERTYGEYLNHDWAIGYFPVRLGNAIWRVRAPITFGNVYFFADRALHNQGLSVGIDTPASVNALCQVQKLPQGLASLLPVKELADFLEFYQFAFDCLQWREELPDTDWFNTARNDYDQSTVDVLAGRFSQARWGVQQAIEKTIKGLLTIAGIRFQTRGAAGHDLLRLAEQLAIQHEVVLDSSDLALVSCPPSVRYGEERSTESQAFMANHAALRIFGQLSESPSVTLLLAPTEHRDPD